MTIGGSGNCIDHTRITNAVVRLEQEENAAHDNAFVDACLTVGGTSNSVVRNTFQGERSCVSVEDGCSGVVVSGNRFCDNATGTKLCGSMSDVLISNNAFAKTTSPHVICGDDILATITTNEYRDCGPDVTRIATQSTERNTTSIAFTNNVMYDGDAKEQGFVFRPAHIRYSSNVLYSGRHTDTVPGVLHLHANAMDGRHTENASFGHDETHNGALTGRYNAGSTQLFKPVIDFNRSLRSGYSTKAIRDDIRGVEGLEGLD